jgi:hypothetical protein
VLASCSVYDSTLIAEMPQGVGRAPIAGATGGAGKSGSGAGSTGEVGSGDLDAGELPHNPVPIDVHCGDGRVTGDEKCDIGIAAGTPGSCPTTCPELAPCNPRALNNSGCQAECVLLQMVCMAGDGCCPGNCTDKNDSDCSSDCGDGMIQSESGETCEPESTTPCKQNDGECDDKEACTVDKLVGSAKNCNALCTNTRITSAKNDDGCCPLGSDANGDSDCKPVCGNKIRETGEDCDGTTGCSAQCKLTLQEDQIRCLEKFGNSGDECAKCSCMNCADTYLDCVDNPMNSESNPAIAQCISILSCARKNDCWGTACYCGGAFLCTLPSGDCKMEIEVAAGSTDPAVINTRANDATTTLGRAYAADTCRYAQCARQCR